MDLEAIDHVQIAAPSGSEEEARCFFGSVLGLPEVQKPPALRARGGVWFSLGSQALHVGIEDPFRPQTKGHPAFRVAHGRLEAVANRLRHAGAPVRWDHSLPGIRRFYTQDPWGNRIELLSEQD